ncbi:MAG TPA: hypothetical protein VF172_13355 [Nitrososphaera sp.]
MASGEQVLHFFKVVSAIPVTTVLAMRLSKIRTWLKLYYYWYLVSDD